MSRAEYKRQWRKKSAAYEAWKERTREERAAYLKANFPKRGQPQEKINEWRRRKPWHGRMNAMRHYAGPRQPPWLTREMKAAMKAMYVVAVRLGLTVDHIEPLKGKDANGLHVPWNLQLLPLSENQRKSNTRAK